MVCLESVGSNCYNRNKMNVKTVDQLIASSQPQGRLWRGPTLILLGLSILLGAVWADPGLLPVRGSVSWLLPQLLLLAIFLLIIHDTIRQRRANQLMQTVFEAVQLQQWPQARDSLSLLLRSPIRRPMARIQSLLALAAVTDADHEYEASQRIYEHILEQGLGSPIQQHTAQVALGATMLRTGQTADAVTLIDRLLLQDLPEPLRAQVELLTLFREVVMGHTHESVTRAEDRVALFRTHLSTRAGYGYALLAAAFERANQPEAARRYWRDATLLVPAKELVNRFGELEPIANRYPAVEYPL